MDLAYPNFHNRKRMAKRFATKQNYSLTEQDIKR